MKNFLLLFQAGLTGCLLFSYVFVLSNPEQILPVIIEILKIVVLISIAVVFVNTLSFLIIDFWFTHKQGKQPSKLLKFTVSVVLYGIAAAVVLQVLGKDTTQFFTTSALFAAVVGFAMQEPLGNLLSGVFLQINQPFQIGDWIEFQALDGMMVEGVVESVDWDSTDIRQKSGEITYIPNGSIAKNLVKMAAAGNVYRMVDFTVPPNIPPNQVMDIACKALINQPPANINLDKPLFARMWSYGLEEISYKLFYYPKNYSEAETHTDPEIRCRLWYALNRAGLTTEYQQSEKQHLLQLVNAVEFFRGLSLEAKSLIIEESKTLLFDREELLDNQQLLSGTMFLVVSGSILVENQLIHTSEGNITIPLNQNPQNDYRASLALKPPVIEQVSVQLAKYIGPVAFSLTKEAAKTAPSLYNLYLTLSSEIHNPQQREEFLLHQPPAPTEELLVGDFFGEMCLFLGQPLPKIKITTIEETQLLGITPNALLSALERDGIAINVIAEQVRQYYHTYLSGSLQELPADLLDQKGIVEQIQQYFESRLALNLRA
ncbi:mechanosensitive ion channel protein MscS [Cylindrospermopsis raciborskii S07]|uniref:mechanosensitive ion channel domain-containing protein n=1 Tax=Cylindrospermopsis raciborskii TaxID=77022 RepID=UPI000C9DFE94|nr:mechanosensitive ion channel domain-containing protein [Cylindrospermopsis raciborskii]PNK01792.1 mechanosensitive ion channel protein MscS [Cylindrospermopsis raciborskii S10]PNK04517.1 mechanosensitive ion channel protein MscS [Cylindrospermopsis raciborskii S07]PNK06589.1 mechanosensitive ion channel protein MscS [Cylindrospermopsis raciborskii S14]PNK11829.1 mechanosensitive ion channel protein MscS [Cylindrospermopsis raciborskii S06]PNK19400.1 mechanosensitive ion channel protein MscS